MQVESAFVLHSFVLGTLSYIILYLIRYILSLLGVLSTPDINEIRFLSIIDRNGSIDIIDVLYATFVSIPLTMSISYIETRKFLSKISRRLKISTRFSEPDVWGYVLNSDILSNNEWITIRSKKTNLMYQGRIRAFSDSFKEAEIFLEEVYIYKNDTGEKLYCVDFIYLTLDPFDIEIQFYKPYLKEGESNDQ